MKKLKFIYFTLALLLAIGVGIPTGGYANDSTNMQSKTSLSSSLSDVKGHWAEQTITGYVYNNVVQGYPDGTFKPDSSITRAELVTIINKLFGFQQASSELSFSDVTMNDWFFKDVATAQNAKYISGYADNTFRADNQITREETAVLITNILSLKRSSSANSFTDTNNSPEWSKSAIGSVIDAKIMNGYESNVFRPTSNLTRAEALTVLEKALAAKSITYKTAGVYGPETGVEKIKQNVIIDAANVTLRNVEIEGDLLLGKGIGEGDVTLKNVNVHGTTTVRGGGENSIHFEDSIMVTIVVDKATGKVRIVANGATQVGNVTVQSNAKIEAETGSKINSVTLSEALPKDSRIQLVGSFETVNVVAQSIVIELPKGSVKDFNVGKAASDTKIDIGNEAAILSLILNAATNISGQGKISNATVNSEGVSMEKAPEKTTRGADVPSDVKLKVGGNEVKAEQPASGTAPSGGGDNSNGNGTPGNDTTPGTGGGPIITPIPSGPTPILSKVTYQNTVGENVYAVSDLDGWIYIVENGTTRNSIILDEAVKGGKGVKIKTKANIGSYINTTGLSKTKVHFVVVAVSSEGKISDPSHIKLYAGPSDPLQYGDTIYFTGDYTNKKFGMYFNKDILNNLADMNALKAAISFSNDSVSFQPLSNKDEVVFEGNTISVTFDVYYTGTNNKLKLNAGSIKDNFNHVFDQELISKPIRAVPLVKKMSNASTFQAGQTVTVRVNQAETVYLIRSNFYYNTRFDLENEVVAKRAIKVVIDTDKANVDVDIPTIGLEPGNYQVMIYGSNSFPITINAAP
ncbi:hypothetical protein QFZ81_006695 [Paenibacillus sp. V4I9]|uniref:S-layer homology domain-containing protein n=1 Tax=Paenibacillus sp. V4I9 TaxID=3042308 RepID=UPI00278BA802|nr:S-layer homology domain-containing protein [Paenibacillus sp. V4I9]MDQ0891607.1 hypothetical protein [Paenibacillus sp. V4I9]